MSWKLLRPLKTEQKTLLIQKTIKTLKIKDFLVISIPTTVNDYLDNSKESTQDATDQFDQKVSLFIERCEKTEIEYGDDCRKESFIVLAGYACEYYFQTLKNFGLVFLLIRT